MMEQNESGLPGSQMGFEEVVHLLEAFKEMATTVLTELIRKPAVNKTYNYHEYHAPVYHYNGIADNNESAKPKITLTKEMLYQIVPRIQHFFRGSSSYAVLFCVGRDEFNYPDNMSQFEREMGDCPEPEQLDYLCPAGTLASAFYHNSYLKLPVRTWKDNGVKDKVLILADQFRTAVKEMNSKKESDKEI